MCHFPPLDDHIDAFEVFLGNGKVAYLHTSPEYGMKRLLSQGAGDIFQMSHVFRKDEMGRLHNPEFTMVEWYRVGMDFSAFIEETAEFIQLFLGRCPIKRISYADILHKALGIDVYTVEREELLTLIDTSGIPISSDILSLDKNALLQWLMGFVIEPKLVGETVWIIEDFPAEQAALSQVVKKNGRWVAERFEVYYEGIELANGYGELTDAKVQKERFEQANLKRASQGKHPYPIDTNLLKALKEGLPPSCGVAVGLDRLIMLHLEAENIADIIPFSFDLA